MKRVIVYGHDFCPGTDRARAFLAARGIRYIARDVCDPRWSRRMNAYGIFATPYLLFGRQRMIGFDEAAMERWLAGGAAGKGGNGRGW